MTRTPTSLLTLALLLLGTPAWAQDFAGEYRLRGMQGWVNFTRSTLEVRSAGRNTYDVVRRLDTGAELRGHGRQRGRVLDVEFPVRRGLVHALAGSAAPRSYRARYRILGPMISGWATQPGPVGDEVRVFEAGRRVGGLAPSPVVTAGVSAGATATRTPERLGGRLRVVGRRLVDPTGREVTLRGANVGVKRAPFLPPHTPAEMQAAVDATGLNFVRLVVAWRAIEPQPLVYDQAYLDALTDHIRDWNAVGVYVLVDMHQDLWGGPLAGHGAPDWATLAASEPALNLPASAPWQLRYLDRRAYLSFEALWADDVVPATGLGLQEHYARAWSELAARLTHEDLVVGYDLMNEPFYGREVRGALVRLAAGSSFWLAGTGAVGLFRALLTGGSIQDEVVQRLMLGAQEPRRYARLMGLLGPATRAFERRLAAFYGRIGRAVRAVDPGRPLFVEPMALVGVGVPSQMPAIGLGQVVYAPHLYDAFVDSGQPYDGDPRRVARTLEAHVATSRRLNVPLVLGEWGHLTHATGDVTAFARDMSAMIDEVQAGSAYWDHVPGRESDPLFREAVHPFPRRVAGTLQDTTWDPVARELTVRYAADSSLDAPTVIAAPRGAFGGAVAARASDPSALVEVDEARGLVLVWTRQGGPVTVTVTPR
jgi:endoglycosylceramidase